MAGSILISTPNTEVLIRLSASTSNEYGIAEDSIPTTPPRSSERGHELERDRDAQRDPVQSRVEAEVHAGQDQPEGRREQQLVARVAVQARSPEREEDDRPEQEAQPHRPARTDLSKQLRRDRRT